MENIEKIKKQLECIRGLTFMGLDKIWFEEQGKITKEERDEEINACVCMLDTFVNELKEMIRDEIK